MKNIGKKLYNFTNNVGKFLINNKCVFYILSFTWGIIMTAVGLLVLLIFLPFKKVKVYKKRLYVPVGEFWGGITLGIIFFIPLFPYSCNVLLVISSLVPNRVLCFFKICLVSFVVVGFDKKSRIFLYCLISSLLFLFVVFVLKF